MALTIAEQKILLRRVIREQRNQLTNIQVENFSNALFNKLIPVVQNKPNIAIYHAIKNEISLKSFIGYLLSNSYNVFRPLAIKDSQKMFFQQIYDDKHYDIFTNEICVTNSLIECYNLDLIIVPLLAIDYNGYRLGQGGGYYDLTLANAKNKVLKCGVGYDWQLIDSVPHDSFDIAMDMFVSDKRVVYFK